MNGPTLANSDPCTKTWLGKRIFKQQKKSKVIQQKGEPERQHQSLCALCPCRDVLPPAAPCQASNLPHTAAAALGGTAQLGAVGECVDTPNVCILEWGNNIQSPQDPNLIQSPVPALAAPFPRLHAEDGQQLHEASGTENHNIFRQLLQRSSKPVVQPVSDTPKLCLCSTRDTN